MQKIIQKLYSVYWSSISWSALEFICKSNKTEAELCFQLNLSL